MTSRYPAARSWSSSRSTASIDKRPATLQTRPTRCRTDRAMPPPGRPRRGSGTTASSPRSNAYRSTRPAIDTLGASCCWWPPIRVSRSTIPDAGIRSVRSGSGRCWRVSVTRATMPYRHLEPRAATRAELERVHTPGYLDELERVCAAGGGALDPDTAASARSWEAATHAAGAGLEAVAALERGDGDAAFCAVRPPGHHALASRAMGFCLLNNVAVTAAHLRDRGETVLVIDWDAHHGNGTQDIFYDDADVFYVSMHEWPLYPGTGRIDEIGTGPGRRHDVELPVPGGHDRRRLSRRARQGRRAHRGAFRPDWVLDLGRLRRPPGRPADRSRALGRRLRRSDRPGDLAGAGPGVSSRSSRVATTSTPCALRSPRPRRPWSDGELRPEAGHVRRPRAGGRRTPSGGPARMASRTRGN